MLVLDGRGLHETDILLLSRSAVAGGVNVIQAKDSGGWRESSGWLIPLAKDPQRAKLVFVHSSDAVAASVFAEGVHLPEALAHDLGSIRDRWLGVLISRSVHSLEAAVQAERDGADLLVLGTVFPSSSHPGGPTIGLDGVRAVCEAVSIPVIGIGGITVANAGDLIRAGASGVAVISAIVDAEDPRAAAAELRTAIDAAWAERH